MIYYRDPQSFTKIYTTPKNSRLQKSDCAISGLRTQTIIPSGDLELEFFLPSTFSSEILVAEGKNQKLRIDKQSPSRNLNLRFQKRKSEFLQPKCGVQFSYIKKHHAVSVHCSHPFIH
jgi:hypothetical protein